MRIHRFETFSERFGKIENFRIFDGREDSPPGGALKNLSKPKKWKSAKSTRTSPKTHQPGLFRAGNAQNMLNHRFESFWERFGKIEIFQILS